MTNQDFLVEELVEVELQKGVLGLPKPLGCAHPALLEPVRDNNNLEISNSEYALPSEVNNKKRGELRPVQEDNNTRKIRLLGRKRKQMNYINDVEIRDSNNNLISVESHTLDIFKEGAQ